MLPVSLATPALDLAAWASAAGLALPLAALAAVALDRLLGEVRRWHPLVGFGKLADGIERALRRRGSRLRERGCGLIAWSLTVLPFVALATLARHWLVDVALLYLALGGRSLAEHAARVGADLESGELEAAREHVGWIVSRDTRELDASGVAKACVESTLENGNDAVFGALFWFALLGGPGAVLFRLANTLDAMWGYKNERFLHFGWAAARIDDVLNFVPARLTAIAYALCGNPRRAFACWRAQAPAWESPNAGPVMAAGAGSLGLVLGGAAIYAGEVEERPQLGAGRAARGEDIARALTLLRRATALWLVVIFCIGALGA